MALIQKNYCEPVDCAGDPELIISLILAFGTGDAVLCTSLNTAAAQTKPTAKTSIFPRALPLRLQLRLLNPQTARTLSGRRPNDGERCHMASPEYSQIISSFRRARSLRVQEDLADEEKNQRHEGSTQAASHRLRHSQSSTLHCPHSVCCRSSAPALRWL